MLVSFQISYFVQTCVHWKGMQSKSSLRSEQKKICTLYQINDFQENIAEDIDSEASNIFSQLKASNASTIHKQSQ